MDFLNNILEKGITQFHVTDICKKHFLKMGFHELNIAAKWNLTPGAYFVSPYPSMLIAFVVGEAPVSFRFAAAHTDFPMLKLKSNPEITMNGYVELNVEPYGGLILTTWFDRPLGLAGKVILKGKDSFSPKIKLFDSARPLFILPSLAPHLRPKGKTEEMNVQKEILPLFTLGGKDVKKAYLLEYLAKEMNVAADAILDYDLYLYNCDSAYSFGLNNEFLTAPRIDNISSVAAIAEALCSKNIKNCIAVGAFFDNEEIGSRSKQGADSMLLRDIIGKITTDEKLLWNSFNLSVDVAHATHPNYTEKSDPTNDVILGNGVVLKTSAAQKYVTDSEAGAVFISLCKEKEIKYQRQVNRSGIAGGQTLGPIMSAYLPVKSADIGIPMLAMHSASETICGSDYLELKKLITAYYQY